MARWRCEQCGGTNEEETKFCGHCGNKAPEAAKPAEAISERRLLTALFADISGFTSLADTLDPEELSDAIDPLVAHVAAVVQRHGGFVDKFAGDAVLALYGAPDSHEDDPQRAMRTALQLHHDMPEQLTKLPAFCSHLTLHVGVNTGRAIVRNLARNDGTLDYSAMGDVLNTCQRLESLAPSGETYVGELTVRLGGDAFELEPMGRLEAKGKAHGVLAWRLVGEASPGTRRPSVAVVHGRDSEVEEFTRVVQSGAALAVLRGEAGMGKSTIIEAVQRRTEATHSWLFAPCRPTGSAAPYAPFADALHALSLDGDLPTDLAPLFGPVDDDDDLGPEARRRRLHDALRAWFAARAAQDPIVLAVEDLHNADASTLDALDELLAEPIPGMTIVATTRPGGDAAVAAVGGTKRAAIDRTLTSISRDEVRKIVEAGLEGAGAVGDDVVTLVADRSGGNPFFAVELVEWLESEEVVRLVNGAWRLRADAGSGLPPTVEAVLSARLDRLGATQASVLQHAAVIGVEIPRALLDAITGDAATLADDVDALVESGLLERDVEDPGIVRFHHHLLHAAAYERLLVRDRRRLHLAIADAGEPLGLFEGSGITELARHCYLARAGARAVDALAAATRLASSLFANEEALLHADRAVEIADEGEDLKPRVAELLCTAAEIADRLGEYEGAAERATRARDGAGLALAWAALIGARRRQGRYDEALAEAAAARQRSIVGDARLVAAEEAWTLALAGRADDAMAVARAGLDASPDEDVVAGRLLLRLADLYTEDGHASDALAFAERARAAFAAGDDQLGVTTSLRMAGGALLELDEPERAVTTLREALELARKTGVVEEIGGTLVNLGLAEQAAGRLDAAISCDAEALAEFQRVDHRNGMIAAEANLADKLTETGELVRAREHAEQALALAKSIDYRYFVGCVTDTLARIELATGDPAVAAQQFEAAAEELLAAGVQSLAVGVFQSAAGAWRTAGDVEAADLADSRAAALLHDE